MKKLLFSAFALILACCPVSAQDIIQKKNAEKIQARVMKVSITEIEYKRWDNPDGPIYVIPIQEVSGIAYQNGSTDKFSVHHPKNEGKFPRYQGEFGIGYGLGLDEDNHFSIETVHGIRFRRFFFAGIGIGYNRYSYDDFMEESAGVMPLFIKLTDYFTISPKAAVYLSFDVGTAIGVSGWTEGDTDWYFSVGPGIDFGKSKGSPRGDFSIRYQHMGEGLNAILFRVGINF